MKANKLIIAALLGASIIACTPGAGAQEGVEGAESSKDYIASKAQKDSVAYLVGINFGSFIKGYNFGEDLDWGMIKKGMMDFINAKGDQRDPEFTSQFRINPEEMNDLFNSYLEKRQKYTALVNKEKGEAYLAANAKKAGVETTESGLQYKIENAGSDVKATSLMDTVLVRYKGTLIDGTTFDECGEDREPVAFPLNGVVAGFGEGLQLVGEGGKITLYMPAELAYGERGQMGIEPNSTLIFDVDVIEVKPYKAVEAEE